MAGERLPVNIFPGMLPGSYVFLDDGSDDSKWKSVVGPSAFDDISTGDAYGFYGKGLQFKRTGLCTAYAIRSSVGGPVNSYFFGFTVRPHSELYAGDYTGKRIGFMSLFPRIADDDMDFLKIAIETGSASSARGKYKVGFASAVNNPISTIICENTQVRIVGTVNDLPWIRISAVIRDGVCEMVSVNGRPYITNQSCGVDLFNFPTGVMVEGKFDLAGDSIFDIDQIWISDTENRV